MPRDAPVNISSLRVAIVMGGWVQPLWVELLIRSLSGSEFCEVAFVGAVPPLDGVNSRLLNAVGLFEHLRHKRLLDPLARSDARRSIPHGIPTAEFATISRAEAHLAARGDFDLCLDLTGDVQGAGRGALFGRWLCFHASDVSSTLRVGGFWDVFHDASTTESGLYRCLGTGSSAQAYRAVSPVHRTSLYRTNVQLYLKSPQFVERMLSRLATGHLEESSELVDVRQRNRTAPSSRDALFGLVKLIVRSTARLVERSTKRPRWVLAVHESAGPTETTSAVPHPQLADYSLLLPPRHAFWADPFVAISEGRTFVFFENYDRRLKRGHIGVLEMLSDGKWLRPVPVICEDHHMSYPFVFSSRGEWYMIPETSAVGRVSLYRATDFPLGWAHEQTLLAGVNAADASVIELEGLWWMFVSIGAPGTLPWDELHLYSSDSLTGDWKPHPKNPVVSDVRAARPAGRLFWEDGVLYRPSQDSSRRYGRAVVINQVDVLTRDGYSERPVRRIEADWSSEALGTHTHNAAGGLSAVDIRLPRTTSVNRARRAPWAKPRT